MGLVDNIKDFLLELGDGFAYVGKQYKLNVGVTEYFTNELPKKFSNYLTKEKKQ